MEQEDYSVLLTDDCYQYITKDCQPKKRKIVTAANLHIETGVMLVGSRHWSPAMMAQGKAMNLKMNTDRTFKQGFIDQFDQFISREDAKRIAIANGQPLIGKDWHVLFSENLH